VNLYPNPTAPLSPLYPKSLTGKTSPASRPQDANERIVQHTVIHAAGRHDGCGFQLVHTHLSYHRETQVANVAAVMALAEAAGAAGALQVLVGGASPCPCRTARWGKWRIVTLRWARGDGKWALERGTTSQTVAACV
jgi:hypothetical protein